MIYKLVNYVCKMKKYRKPRNDGTPSSRKVRGLNFYIQSNEKLRRKDRSTLLQESEHNFGLIRKELENSGWSNERLIREGIESELDPNTTDLDMMNIWNFHYDNYGHMMDDHLRNQWLKEHEKDIDDPIKRHHVFQSLIERIQDLERRVDQLESKTKQPPEQKISF